MGKIKNIIDWWKNRLYWQKGGIIGFIFSLIIVLPLSIFSTILQSKMMHFGLITLITYLSHSIIRTLFFYTGVGVLIGYFLNKTKKQKKKSPLGSIIILIIFIIIFILFILKIGYILSYYYPKLFVIHLK